MKILICPDKYKGSLSALEVGKTIRNTIKELDRNIVTVLSPMADGGEGTVDTLIEGLNGKRISYTVTGPLGKKVKACFGIIKGKTAVIEMSSASGLFMVPREKRNPMETTTYGTGELIKKAIEMGCRKVIIGIGGSATNDGGIGMAGALGVKFYDRDNVLLPGKSGSELTRIGRIDTSGLLDQIKETEIYVACDVSNPLTGKNGAAYIYGPQKGAGADMVRKLDEGLKNYSRIIKKDLGKDIERQKGSGAAGGLGAGLVAFLDAELKPGVEIIIESINLREKMRDADLVITGEGAMDNQTYFGKSAYGVAKLAREFGVPVISINGSVLLDKTGLKSRELDLFDGVFSIINKPMSLDYAEKNATGLLKDCTEQIIRFYLSFVKK